MSKDDNRHESRAIAIQFLYQCEIKEIYFFNAAHFASFTQHFALASHLSDLAEKLCAGVFANFTEIDKKIEEASEKWSLSRMGSMDRMTLRLAVYELLKTDTPAKVVINEAIELAKRYGTEQSSKFVNGVLDNLAKTLRQET